MENNFYNSRAISNLCTDEGNHGGASSQNSNLRKEISQSFYSNAKRVRVNETKLPSRSYTHMHSEQKQGGTDKRNYERITIRGRRTQSNSSSVYISQLKIVLYIPYMLHIICYAY